MNPDEARQAWTTAKAEAEPVGSMEDWKRLMDQQPPPLVSIEVNYGIIRKHTIKVDLALCGAHVPFGQVKAEKSPWWWPRRLARANYHKAPSRWLWLGMHKPWWFRRWFNE